MHPCNSTKPNPPQNKKLYRANKHFDDSEELGHVFVASAKMQVTYASLSAQTAPAPEYYVPVPQVAPSKSFGLKKPRRPYVYDKIFTPLSEFVTIGRVTKQKRLLLPRIHLDCRPSGQTLYTPEELADMVGGESLAVEIANAADTAQFDDDIEYVAPYMGALFHTAYESVDPDFPELIPHARLYFSMFQTDREIDIEAFITLAAVSWDNILEFPPDDIARLEAFRSLIRPGPSFDRATWDRWFLFRLNIAAQADLPAQPRLQLQSPPDFLSGISHNESNCDSGAANPTLWTWIIEAVEGLIVTLRGAPTDVVSAAVKGIFNIVLDWVLKAVEMTGSVFFASTYAPIKAALGVLAWLTLHIVFVYLGVDKWLGWPLACIVGTLYCAAYIDNICNIFELIRAEPSFPNPRAIRLDAGLDATCLNAIAAVFAATIATLCIPDIKCIDTFLMRADRLPKAITGIGRLSEHLSALTEFVKNQIITCFGGVASFDKAIPEDVDRVIHEIMELAKTENVTAIPTDEPTRLHIGRAFQTFYRLRTAYHGNRTVTTLLDKYAGVIGSLNSRASSFAPGRNDTRPKPVVTFLRGKSGVGKSELLYFVAASVLSKMNVINDGMSDDEINKLIGKCMYSRMVEQEYWDGANEQLICLYDDFGQQKDSAGNPNLEWMELIRVANRYPYPLHMARIEQKDSSYFSAKHMFATTNLTILAPESLVEREAVLSRIDFGFEVRVKRQYQIDPDSTDEMLHRIDRNKVDGFTTDIYTFVRWDPSTGGVGEDEISYKDMIKLIVAKQLQYDSQHDQSKRALVSHARAELQGATLSVPVTAINPVTYVRGWNDLNQLSRITGVGRFSLCYLAAMNEAMHYYNNVKREFDRLISPRRQDLKALFKWLGLIVAASGMAFCYLSYRRSRNVAQTESGRDLRTALPRRQLEHPPARAPAAVPESGRDARPLINRAVLEGVFSSQAEETAQSIKRNYWMIERVFVVLGIKGRYFLTNRHVWDQVPQKFDFRSCVSTAAYEIDKSEVKVFNHPRDETCDIIIIQMPDHVRMVRTILHHFVDACDFNDFIGARIMHIVPGSMEDGAIFASWRQMFGRVSRYGMIEADDESGNTYKVTVLETDMSSRPGDCAGIYILDDNRFNCKVAAMHFAGWIEGGTMGFPLIRSDFDFLDGPQIAFNAPEYEGHFPLDSVIVEGYAPKAPSASKTKLVKTPIFGEVQETTVAPAQLAPILKPGGPGLKSLSKISGTVMHISDAEIAKAVHDYKERLYENTTPEPVHRTLTFDEAAKGIPDHPYIRPIQRSRSAGYPWTLISRNGKRKWFGTDEWTLGAEAEPIREAVEHKRNQMLKQIWEPSLYTDTLKDETRPIEKVLAGKTRTIAAAPVDLIILIRMYFLSFFSFVMRNRIYNEVAVGIMCQSPEWDKLARRMLYRGGNRIIAGDFTNFDGTLHPKILRAVLTLVQDYYRDHCAVRGLLFEDICHSWHITDSCVNSWFKSQPSGNPGTAIFNSIYNSLAVRIAAARINPNVQFNNVATMVSYGDDNLIAVSAGNEWLNQQSLTKAFSTFGMTYTSETKGTIDSIYRDLEDVSFLKRGFRYDYGQCMWMAPLERNSINERLNWHLKNKNEWQVLQLNAEAALLEWSLHHDGTFSHWSDIIINVFRKHGKHINAQQLSHYRSLVRDGTAAQSLPQLTYA
uniref:Nonstructural polyprotein n=1 Tax=Rodent dicistro-like virus TaxID=2864002 RepID=A0A8K1HI10_9VIRU|nr:nonstructural polyprotein [Rodent dicistro-like virus]